MSITQFGLRIGDTRILLPFWNYSTSLGSII
jgi:hypothetical protein